MATPCHEPDVLRALADTEPGPARDWALSRLALSGHAPPSLPEDLQEAEVCLAAAPEGIVDVVIRGLEDRQPIAPYIAMRLGAYGLLPEGGPLADALRGMLGGGGLDDLIAACALAQLEPLGSEALRCAAEARGRDQLPWILPLLLLKSCTTPEELTETSTAIAKGFAQEPAVLRTLLVQLGVPLFAPGPLDPEAAVALGARLAGSELPAIRRPKGSTARREAGWVQALLEDQPGPAAALLRAIYRDRGPKGLNGTLGAAWLRLAEPTSPLRDVLLGGFGADPVCLSAARRALTPSDAPAVREQLTSPAEPTAVLAAALMRDHPDLRRWFLDAHRTHDSPLGDRATHIAWLAAHLEPDAVETLLRDDPSAPHPVVLARYVQTEEVLDALLSRRLPHETDARAQLAATLAATADPSAARPLRDLCALDRDPRIDGARRLLERMLNQPV